METKEQGMNFGRKAVWLLIIMVYAIIFLGIIGVID